MSKINSSSSFFLGSYRFTAGILTLHKAVDLISCAHRLATVGGWNTPVAGLGIPHVALFTGTIRIVPVFTPRPRRNLRNEKRREGNTHLAAARVLTMGPIALEFLVVGTLTTLLDGDTGARQVTVEVVLADTGGWAAMSVTRFLK